MRRASTQVNVNLNSRCMCSHRKETRGTNSTALYQNCWQFNFRFQNMILERLRWILYITVIDVLPFGLLQSAGKNCNSVFVSALRAVPTEPTMCLIHLSVQTELSDNCKTAAALVP